MSFTVTFHGPFHVLTGYADDGVDLTVDRVNPLPGSRLKGVMRASAGHLPIPTSLVDATFGTAASPSAWSWSDARLSDGFVVRRRSRIARDDHGGIIDGALVSFDEIWAKTAVFTVDQVVPGFGDAELDGQQHVLAASAGSVRSLGASRNRGFGWVSLRAGDLDPAVVAAAVATGLATTSALGSTEGAKVAVIGANELRS